MRTNVWSFYLFLYYLKVFFKEYFLIYKMQVCPQLLNHIREVKTPYVFEGKQKIKMNLSLVYSRPSTLYALPHWVP